jgi:HEAT repeat protein
MKITLVRICLALLTGLTSGTTALSGSADDLKAVLKDLKSNNAGTRAAAVEEIGHRGAVRASDVKTAIPLVAELVKKDRDAKVRQAAATALGQMDPDPAVAVPVLTEALRDKVPAVRIAAAGALGLMGSAAKDSVKALQEMQKDKDRNVSRAASMALQSVRGRNR